MITRKVITSALLFILSFNWLGYDIVFSFMNRHLQDVARTNIDLGRYNPTTLREIRVDLGLPYPTDWNEFEKISGTVTVNGVVYEFVERKYEKGQMVYRCLPNIRSTELQETRNAWMARSVDTEPSDHSGSIPVNISLFKKLNIESTVEAISSALALMPDLHRPQPSDLAAVLLDGHPDSDPNPPEA